MLSNADGPLDDAKNTFAMCVALATITLCQHQLRSVLQCSLMQICNGAFQVKSFINEALNELNTPIALPFPRLCARLMLLVDVGEKLHN